MTPHDEVVLWDALAEHFLDTETRHLICEHARLCLDLRISVSRARHAWQYEVAPAVWPNLWDVVGEWAGWDPTWLVHRIRRKRNRWPNRPGSLAYLVYRLRIQGTHQTWVAIEKCMELMGCALPDRRLDLVRDLSWLSQHFFDAGTPPLEDRDSAALRQLFEESFLPIFSPLVVSSGPPAEESPRLCRARVERALATRPIAMTYRG